MQNNPNDVTSLLTELMQRISDEDLTDDKLEMEIERGKAVADISKNVLAIWNMQVRIDGIYGIYGIYGMNSTKIQTALIEEATNRTTVAHVTATQIGELCRAKGFSNGLDTRFQEKHTINLGRKKANALPDGAEIVNADGYTLLKSDGIWRFKHITLWEQVHGRSVPEGHYIVFGDGDKSNFDAENLFCMTATQNAIRTRNGLQGATPELAAAGVALAKLYSHIGERGRGRKKKSKLRRKRVLKAY